MLGSGLKSIRRTGWALSQTTYVQGWITILDMPIANFCTWPDYVIGRLAHPFVHPTPEILNSLTAITANRAHMSFVVVMVEGRFLPLEAHLVDHRPMTKFIRAAQLSKRRRGPHSGYMRTQVPSQSPPSYFKFRMSGS